MIYGFVSEAEEDENGGDIFEPDWKEYKVNG